MDLQDKYDIGTTIVCVKEYLTYKIDNFYKVKGFGGLSYNADPKVNGRKGWGVCVAAFKKPDDMKDDGWTYLDTNELENYFITYDEYYKIYERNKKIELIIK